MKKYVCIDLKSFYASVECVERGLDPYKVNLVVTDASRGKGAITLAATPAIKKYGVKSRGRLFEIPKGIEYIAAMPRMQLYMEYSVRIYKVLLRYIASEDIYVYSIDESFIDLTPYLNLYKKTELQISKMLIDEIKKETGITATAGIGTNLFLAKVALDITAKHSLNNMGYLDESLFKQQLWFHHPLTDFWMIGRGISQRLNRMGIYDMHGLAQCQKTKILKEFGVVGEFLYDHAWGIEPTTIAEIKAYRPRSNSLNNSQILFEEYTYQDTYLILKEMVDVNVTQLVEQGMMTNLIGLSIRYAKEAAPSGHISHKIGNVTNDYKILMAEFRRLFEKLVKPEYRIKQIGVYFGNLVNEAFEQLDLFTDYDEVLTDRKIQKAIIEIRHKYGKNAVLKGMNLEQKSTMKMRNTLIGGHHA